MKNGLNYSMFLESIIRIAYHKLEEEGHFDSESAYKNILEQMFNESNIELKKRMMDDRLLSELYSHDNANVFFQHATLLSAVFSARATLQLENFLELSKEDFMGILIESGILNEKIEDPQASEIRKKFTGENIMTAIAHTGTFDRNYLTYVDFLECLIRVAAMYPFSEADRVHFQSMDSKLEFVIGQLSEKYAAIVGPFIEIMAKRENEQRYVPRIVIDDDMDDEYDEYD